MLHPEFPVIAPKPPPRGALGGAEFGGHLGERLGAPEVASKVPLSCHVCSNVASVRSFHLHFHLLLSRRQGGNLAAPQPG